MTDNLKIITTILFEKNKNIYLSAVGGCGKSFLAKQIKDYCDTNKIKCALTSTTGISAFNIGGQTLHSWSKVFFNKISQDVADKIVRKITKNKKDFRRIVNIELLIIDEVSMLGGQYLEVLNYVLKQLKNNDEVFGGIRVLLTGDFLQLPPVNDIFAFESSVWKELKLINLELTIPKRFDDLEWAKMLLRIRTATHTEDDIKKLKERHEAYKSLTKEQIQNYIVLSSKKNDVSKYNDFRLSQLKGIEDIVICKDKAIVCDDLDDLSMQNIDDYTSVNTDDEFDKYFIAQKTLKLKPMSRIMIIKNINPEIGLVNGARGIFLELKRLDLPFSNIDVCQMVIKLDTGAIVSIDQCLFTQQYGDMVYTRIQFPVILSYSISIHKSQGLTLDNVIINLGKEIFEQGQAYVALSRCKNFNNLYLSDFDSRKLMCSKACLNFEKNSKTHKLK